MKTAYTILCLAVVLLSSTSFAQKGKSPQAGPLRPNLGTASTYVIFTGGGAINNTGLTQLTGDVGQDGAYEFNGFPPGTYTGALNRNNGASALAKADLLTAWTANAAVPCDFVLGVGIIDGQSFDPAVYCSGAASTTSGNITFDAHGDANAIFIVKIGGQLDANVGTHILLANNAQAGNIYWFVDGAVNIADNSTFKGTIIARGAITFNGTSSLDGRALVAPLGAITLSANNMSMPGSGGTGNNIMVITPAQGDSVARGMQNYLITWSGIGIGATKTLEYSLDSGMTWTLIGIATGDVFAYSWNVPDTLSDKAKVRVTDQNNLRGISGIFKIISGISPGAITILRPELGEIVVGGTQNYQISWTGSGLALQKTIELSLDGGLTWTTIGTISSNESTYGWNVPDTASTQAVIRITDQNGATGQSGLFTIIHSNPNPGSIVITHPIQGEVLEGGSQNFLITFTSVNVTSQKTLEYSLNGGASWTLIGVMNSDAQSYSWANIPNVATTQALVRITDTNGVTGTSGLFTITASPGVGSINSLTLIGLDNKGNIGNSKTLGISWEYTPDIGTSVEVEYSLDYTATWVHIATVPTAESSNTTWITPSTGYYNPVFIRVTSSLGMTRTSIPFSIGAKASVSLTATNGYAVSNFPNPASSQTTISILLPVTGDVSLTLYDALGRAVNVFVAQHMNAGTHNVPFNSSELESGAYTYILQAGSTRVMGKMNIIN